jgi:hypothetical protein
MPNTNGERLSLPEHHAREKATELKAGRTAQ